MCVRERERECVCACVHASLLTAFACSAYMVTLTVKVLVCLCFGNPEMSSTRLDLFTVKHITLTVTVYVVDKSQGIKGLACS